MKFIGIRISLFLLLAQALLAQAASDQPQAALYLLNAVSGNGLTSNSPATVYRLDSSGQLQVAASLAEGEDQDGVDFVRADYDRRLVVVATPKTTPSRISVISMDQPSVVTRRPLGIAGRYPRFSSLSACLIEPKPGQMEIAQMLAAFKTDRSPSNPNPEIEHEFVATPLGLAGEPEVLPDSDEIRCRSGGYFGTASDHPANVYLEVKPNTSLQVNNGGAKFDLGFPAPASAKTTPTAVLEVKTDAAFVFTSQEEFTFEPSGLGASVHHVYSTASKGWNSLKLPGSDTSVRAFDKWLAFVVAERQPWAVPNGTGVIFYDPLRQRVSPGQAGRMLTNSRGSGDRFGDTRSWFPGTLLCYSIETGKLYRLETGQGDSEIVLIDGSDVYYRVNTSLYKGTIGSSAIDPGVRLANDPAIGNAHWAFLGSN
jgi:hypothetical protein